MAQNPYGYYLDRIAQTVREPDRAFVFLDPDAATARLRCLGVDLSRWHLVSVMCCAPASEFPRHWRIAR